MHAYEAFGLTIHSERPLPVAVESTRADCADVTIRWGQSLGDTWRRAYGSEGTFEFAPDVHRFGWPDLGVIEIDHAGNVLVRELEGVAEGLVEHVLLGSVVADILLSKGHYPLHASAVQVPSGIVAFVGKSGQGKSTLAAALEARGCALHADDLVVVPVGGGLVPYGYGRVKLNPDVAAHLGQNVATLPTVYRGIDKRSLVTLPHGDRKPKPLLGIYRISDGDSIDIDRLDERKSMFELYVNGFRVEVAQHACGAKELLQRCASIAQHVKVFELHRPRALAALPQLTEAVLCHAASLAPAP